VKLERTAPAVWRLTLHTYEMATLMAAARWAGEGGQGELSQEAREQLRQVLGTYETEVRRLNQSVPNSLQKG
jgi:hypothetical protein